jgi:hypothetical protein
VARAHFADVVFLPFGGFAGGASIQLVDQGTSTPISATIYDSDAGAGTLANPLTANATGEFEFFLAAAARIDLLITAQGVTERHTVDVNVVGGAGVSDHGGLTGLADDDHPQYAHPNLATHDALGLATDAELTTHAATSHGVTDHGALTGLADDDHPQYATDADLTAHAASLRGSVVTFIASGNSGTVTTNIPAAVGEFDTNARQRLTVDLTGYTQCRSQCGVHTGAAITGFLGFQFSTDAGSTWKWLDGSTDTSTTGEPKSQFDNTVNNTVTRSAWTTIHADARASVLLRVVVLGGNGTSDPSVYLVALEIR